MGNLGIIIVILLSSGTTYFAVTQMGLGSLASSATVQFSPEVKAYIDAKVGSGGSSVEDTGKLMSRLAEMEKKLSEVDKVNSAYEALQQKNETIEAALEAHRKKQDVVLTSLRDQEAKALRNQMAAICAGVYIKRDTPKGP